MSSDKLFKLKIGSVITVDRPNQSFPKILLNTNLKVREIKEVNEHLCRFKVLDYPFTVVLSKEDEWSFLEDKNNDLKIGDVIIITQETNCMKVNTEKQITGFVCDDPDKIIVEGIFPGGWISKSKITRKILIEELRLATILELVYEHGTLRNAVEKKSPKWLIEKSGTPLSELEVHQKGANLYYKNNGKDMKISPWFMKPISDTTQYKLCFKSGKDLTELGCSYLANECGNLSLKECVSDFNDTNEDLIAITKKIWETGYMIAKFKIKGLKDMALKGDVFIAKKVVEQKQSRTKEVLKEVTPF